MSWLSKFVGGGAPDRTEDILVRHLDRDFITYPMAEGEAGRGQVAEIGHRFGVCFPADLVSHACGQFPGVYVAAKESAWPRPRAFDVGPFWTFLYAVHTFTPLATSEDWMRLDLVTAQFQERTGLQAAPILKLEGDANLFCSDENGAIHGYDHELNQLRPVGMDFWQLFEREIAELVERKNRLIEKAGQA